MGQPTDRHAKPFATINPHAAGIDIGCTHHVVAVAAKRDPQPVRTFRTFSGDLHQLADWLTAVGITTIAMESTGVYWIPVFEILEARGFEVVLVNARHVKHVPGRKTDVNDAQWLQQLHQFGLLRGSFRPREAVVRLRAYLRLRERLIEDAASHILHMQKALMEMNVQLHHAVTDITGVTGMRIIRAIVAGERSPEKLAAYRDVRCAASEATLQAALTGHYREEHVFALEQALDLYDFHQTKITECEKKIEAALLVLSDEKTAPEAPLPAKRHAKGRNEPTFDIRTSLYRLLGADLSQIHGLGPYTVLRLVAECGDDMAKWPTAKHFTSWLCLAPANKISGGRVLSAATRRSSNRAATLLRIAAVNVGRTQTALGAFYRRLASRIGKAPAVTATARASSRSSFTRPFDLEWRTPTPACPPTRLGIVIDWCITSSGAQERWASRSWKTLSRLEEFLRKSGGLLRQAPAMRFPFIAAEKAVHSVTILCRCLRVTRSGFYAWLRRGLSARAQRDLVLRTKLRAFHAASGAVYGRPRLWKDLREDGEAVSEKRVKRLMREEQIQGKIHGGAEPRRSHAAVAARPSTAAATR